jgi:hypothetical protein
VEVDKEAEPECSACSDSPLRSKTVLKDMVKPEQSARHQRTVRHIRQTPHSYVVVALEEEAEKHLSAEGEAALEGLQQAELQREHGSNQSRLEALQAEQADLLRTPRTHLRSFRVRHRIQQNHQKPKQEKASQT